MTKLASDALTASRSALEARTSGRLVYGLVLAIAAAWFLTLGIRHLIPSDEGRYAEIAREMFSSGDWTTIRYNGVKYFEKPPFQIWMTAIAYHAFGVGEWQARLWTATSGAIGLFITMLAARRWFGRRVAALTGLVLLAAPAWNLASHFNSLDMGVAAALACFLSGLLLAQHPEATREQRGNWMLFAWTSMAIASLTKGLIGIAIPVMALWAYTLISREWSLWRRLHLVSGSLSFLVLVAPWFVLVSLENPEFPHFFFIHEHWQRYTSTIHHRSAPWWYFLPQLLIGFVPWLALSWRMARLVREEPARKGFRPILMLAVWSVVIFVFFSLSESKLPGYIVPMYPALGLLAALALDGLDPPAWRRLILITMVFIGAGLLATPALGRLGSLNTPNELYREFAAWTAAICALALAGLFTAYRLRSKPGLVSVIAYSLTVFTTVTAGGLGHEIFGRRSSGIDLAARIDAVLKPEIPVYSVRLLDHTLPFYLRRTTTMVEATDELEFGIEQEPQKWLPTIDDFIEQWSKGPHAVAIMSPATHADLARRNVVMVQLARDTRRVAVANFASSP